MQEESNVLDLPTATAAVAESPAEVKRTAGYPLDWQTQSIKTRGGRNVHTLRRPTFDELLDRDKELVREVPIGKDGSFKLADPTETEDVDALMYDKLLVESNAENVSKLEKAKVFNGLYIREVYIDEETDIFADSVPVVEEVGAGDEPDFTITHVLRQPTEDELKRYRRRSANGTLKPGKRGRQTFVSSSNLRLTMEYYALWLVRVEGATVGGQAYSDELKGAFLENVDPMIQRLVVQTFVEQLTTSLLD